MRNKYRTHSKSYSSCIVQILLQSNLEVTNTWWLRWKWDKSLTDNFTKTKNLFSPLFSNPHNSLQNHLNFMLTLQFRSFGCTLRGWRICGCLPLYPSWISTIKLKRLVPIEGGGYNPTNIPISALRKPRFPKLTYSNPIALNVELLKLKKSGFFISSKKNKNK